MRVSERMTKNIITVTPETTLSEALRIVHEKKIRHLPVVAEGRLVGIVTDRDLKKVSASEATTLSVWELNYLLDRVKIKDFMIRDVISISPELPIDEAAELMIAHRIGSLPVVEDGKVVGILTETNMVETLVAIMS
ncbi:MAG TPA: CBS domain-containing protein [bacterium]|nr:CBS domain-containing protein [bacterium]